MCKYIVLLFTLSLIVHNFSGISGNTPGQRSREKCRQYNNINDEKLWIEKSQPDVFVERNAPKSLPFMATLGYEVGNITKYLCSASIISEKFVITAAHCIFLETWGEVKYVRLGYFLNYTDLKDYKVKRHYIHPEYKYPKRFHNIAVIELDGIIIFSDFISPVCMQYWPQISLYPLYAVQRIGDNGNYSSEQVQVTSFQHCDTGLCSYLYELEPALPGGVDFDYQFCAGALQHINNNCEGDSGGPLVFSGSLTPTSPNSARKFPTIDIYYLAGILTFAKGCSFGGVPAVYISVADYLEWISKTVWPENFRSLRSDANVYPDQVDKFPDVEPHALTRKKCIMYHLFRESGELQNFKQIVRNEKTTKYPVQGGRKAVPREFPFMAALGYVDGNTTRYLCGGSLINEEFVLTAAHCIFSKTWGKVKYIRLGDLNLSSSMDDDFVQEFELRKLYIHPDYRYPKRYNDIALLQLNGSIKITEYVAPVCLDYLKEGLSYKFLDAAGWGALGYGKPSSEHLQVGKLKETNMDTCQEAFKALINLVDGIVESQLCAQSIDRDNLTDTCDGDSGGPLMYNLSYPIYTIYITGITSFGKPCGLANIPAVYTRVWHYLDWIENIVWPEPSAVNQNNSVVH